MDRRFIAQDITREGKVIGKTYAALAGMLAKFVYEFCVFLAIPEFSRMHPGYQYLIIFLSEGNFQNLGMAAVLILCYIFNYDAPNVYLPIDTFVY